MELILHFVSPHTDYVWGGVGRLFIPIPPLYSKMLMGYHSMNSLAMICPDAVFEHCTAEGLLYSMNPSELPTYIVDEEFGIHGVGFAPSSNLKFVA